jgi:hypothetical protein
MPSYDFCTYIHNFVVFYLLAAAFTFKFELNKCFLITQFTGVKFWDRFLCSNETANLASFFFGWIHLGGLNGALTLSPLTFSPTENLALMVGPSDN